MFKALILLVGLIVGFGGGIYWSSHHPDQANKISAAEEKKFLQAQMAITQKIQARLDHLNGKTPDAASQPSADVKQLKADTQTQQVELKKHLDAIQ
jgi:hypothetical protein